MTNPTHYAKSYAKFKHHAWAGLGFLAILLAINQIFSIPSTILIPIVAFLILYILISLVFTYKFRKGVISHTVETYNKLKDEFKLEKKKIKNQLKLEKKKTK